MVAVSITRVFRRVDLPIYALAGDDIFFRRGDDNFWKSADQSIAT